MDNNLTPSEKDFLNKPNPSKKRIFMVVFLAFCSLLLGLIGGAFGAFYLLTTPEGQQILGKDFDRVYEKQIILNENSAIIDVVAKSSPAVVSVVVSEDLNKIPGYGTNPFQRDPFSFFFGSGRQNEVPNIQQVAAGSGFFVSEDGLIMTNKHVVSTSDASYTVITSDGKTYDAKVLSLDPSQDLALIKIDVKNVQYLNFADSAALQIGQQVVAIGNSLGEYQNTVTSGIISGIGRRITAAGEDGLQDLSGVIQTDAAINPGNSGGPLLNLSGNVIGMNTAIDAQGQSVGFAIPSNDISKALNSYQKNGKITRAFLGVRYITLTEIISKKEKLEYNYGALVVSGDTARDFAVVPNSPADKAGITEDDIILEVNGIKVEEQNTLFDILKNYNPEDTVSLKIFSKGKEKTISVVLGDSK